MAITSIGVALKQLRDALAVAYSLFVMATIVPGFGHIAGVIVLPFYALVPGYYAALLLRSTGTITDTFFYSVAWSLAVLTSVYSVTTLLPNFIPISIFVPALTILLLIRVRFRK